MATFEFQYYGMTDRDAGCGTWADNQVVIWGRLRTGELNLGDEIILPERGGDGAFLGRVARFTDSFYEWMGMPFYDRVSCHPVSHFCVCIGFSRLPDIRQIACPGIARNPIDAEQHTASDGA
jgi:hypothetical protein